MWLQCSSSSSMAQTLYITTRTTTVTVPVYRGHPTIPTGTNRVTAIPTVYHTLARAPVKTGASSSTTKSSPFHSLHRFKRFQLGTTTEVPRTPLSRGLCRCTKSAMAPLANSCILYLPTLCHIRTDRTVGHLWRVLHHLTRDSNYNSNSSSCSSIPTAYDNSRKNW